MAKCLRCGKEEQPEDFRFHALTVRTIHLRELGGERRVQGLGDAVDFCVCRECAKRQLDGDVKPGKKLAMRLIPFALILLAGIVLIVFFWHGEGALRLLGLGAVACGVMSLFYETRCFLTRKKELLALDGEQALYRAAFTCVQEDAPKKSGEEDLTYIPINARTLSMKNGDLMIEYELLPDIANQAYRLLHEGKA